ncbi:LysE family translocator [Candidatus Thioglobus sp. NP1]|jgi:threonine/homoserine/homoserine lactone efflux protein|uniref:LysE family translocator n=1 Tax=Candidatus Thioglobus sp. NP1 TaxID=2508687 RepID=UPI000DED4265|nr:LysE family translocator [Candidatus Thioglobus sp. NP1]AXE62331.1 threonine transporter RhtB [Candidatus Thioglobus sp. NP1]|tara:strand:+ start:1194 stop:1823 length:630 start_codon:yes stop_codon:yes gene_type:complete
MIEILSLETVIAFVLASVILSLVPGPDNIYVMTNSALKGWRVGFYTTLGLCTGLIGHTFLVAIGVSVIFQTSALAFNGLKIVGACYLIYLGWLSLQSKELNISGTGKDNSNRSYYITGVIMNLTNPKVALFFLVFLPQFVNISNDSVTIQVVLLGLLFILSALCVFSSIAFLGSFLEGYLKKSSSVNKNINKLAALVYFALAINLFFVS